MYMNPLIFDNGLTAIPSGCRLLLCTSEPATYAQATAAAVASRDSVSIAAPETVADANGGGRRRTIAAFDDGTASVGTTTQATHYAVVHPGSSTIWTAQNLSAAVNVVPGQAVRMTAPAYIHLPQNANGA